jgi:hypothetical protein
MARTLREPSTQRSQPNANRLTIRRHNRNNNRIPGFLHPREIFPTVERISHHYDTANSLQMLRQERYPNLQRIRRNTYATPGEIRLRFNRLFGRFIQVEREIHIFHPFEEDMVTLEHPSYDNPITIFLSSIGDEANDNIIRFQTITRPPSILSTLFDRITRNARRQRANQLPNQTDHILSTAETDLEYETAQ